MFSAEERRIIVERSARYYVVGSPGSHIESVWMLCHGYGQLARDFLRDCEALWRENVLLVAPEGLSRFYHRGGSGDIGASWMTSEDRLAEIDDYVGYLNAIWRNVCVGCGKEPLASVLGFSQGGATAGRWGMFGKADVVRTIIWGALIPVREVQLHADKIRRIGLTLVRGETDPLVNEEEFRKSLDALHRFDIPFELLTHPGGHALDGAILQSLASTP